MGPHSSPLLALLTGPSDQTRLVWGRRGHAVGHDERAAVSPWGPSHAFFCIRAPWLYESLKFWGAGVTLISYLSFFSRTQWNRERFKSDRLRGVPGKCSDPFTSTYTNVRLRRVRKQVCALSRIASAARRRRRSRGRATRAKGRDLRPRIPHVRKEPPPGSFILPTSQAPSGTEVSTIQRFVPKGSTWQSARGRSPSSRAGVLAGEDPPVPSSSDACAPQADSATAPRTLHLRPLSAA